ncbi:MAG: hypothetical protein AAGG68_29480 [Bacteroidota bacterium]
MAILLGLLGLFFPRILIVVLYFFTQWFSGVFDSILWPLLGFIFAPFTLLWYSVVINYFGGQWDGISIIGMVVALAVDFGVTRGASRNRKRRSWA